MNLKKYFLLFLVLILIWNCQDNESILEETSTPYAHFSVDDVLCVLQNLTEENYESVFDQPFFAVWRNLHDNYGVTVTLNLYYEKMGFDLTQMTEEFKLEFEENSHWLKFSFHAGDSNQNYNSTENNAYGLLCYINTYSQIVRFAGKSSLDTFCRFHYFSGNKDFFMLLKLTIYGIDGIYTADDLRVLNSGLSEKERNIINASDDYYDSINDLYYIHSERRLDKESITSVIQIFEDNFNSESNSGIYNYFLHESTVINQFEVLDALCKILVDRGVEFDFPSNNKP
jgi:hypothetical protein